MNGGFEQSRLSCRQPKISKPNASHQASYPGRQSFAYSAVWIGCSNRNPPSPFGIFTFSTRPFPCFRLTPLFITISCLIKSNAALFILQKHPHRSSSPAFPETTFGESTSLPCSRPSPPASSPFSSVAPLPHSAASPPAAPGRSVCASPPRLFSVPLSRHPQSCTNFPPPPLSR